MRVQLRALATNTNGSVGVTAAFALPVLLALGAAEMTYSAATTARANMQAAIDAATLAGASLPTKSSADDRIAEAKQVFAANISETTTRHTTLGQATISSTSSIIPTFTVTKEERVTGSASAPLNFPFVNLIASTPPTLSVTATAERAWSAPICLLALNGSAQGGFDMNGNAEVSAPQCAAMTNSDDSSAMRIVGAATATASEFGVTGGTHGNGFSPPPAKGVEPFADPFADIPLPPIGPCIDIAKKLQQVNVVLTPGTYCDDIDITAQSTVRFEPGIYILKDSMLKIASDAIVTGEEVMFAFTGKKAKLWLSSGATVTLTAPRSGLYAGFQFFQAANDLSTEGGWATIIGGVNLQYEGTFYFPPQHIWIAGGSTVKAKTSGYAMVADKLWFQDSTRTEIELVDNGDEQPVGRFRIGARLIE